MILSIDHNSLIPLHAQVEELLRELIELPDYKSKGKLLPNEANLAKQLGISRNTVRQAINKLVYEGLIVRKKGVGSKVVDRGITTHSTNWLSFTQEMKAKGMRVKDFNLKLSWVGPDENIASFFNIKTDVKVLKMERIRGRIDFPFVYFVSYFDPRIGLTGKEDFTRPLYEILEKDFSVVVKLSKEELSAQLADELLAEKLNIEIGDPILKRKRLVFDPGGRAVEYNVGYYNADSFVYSIESERKI
jgi:GntR family transcriptional regulator